MGGQPADTGSYSLRPAFGKSILHNLFVTADEETDCANQLHLRLTKTNLLSSVYIYRMAHSRLYRLWFVVATLFFTCSVILYQAPWMQRLEATCVVVAVCVVNMMCSLTRVDRTLMRALAQTFEWSYLLSVLYTFIVFNSLAQQQVDTDGRVRATQWSDMQVHGFIQAVALCSPIAFLLANLDAIPLYPIVVKCGILFCGLAILVRVLILDLINYGKHDGTTDEATALSAAHLICVGAWACTTVKAIGNLFAGQVSLFLMRHAFITLQGMRGNRWKQMTILNVPLLVHPHFERKDYQEEQVVQQEQKQENPPPLVIAVPPSLSPTHSPRHHETLLEPSPIEGSPQSPNERAPSHINFSRLTVDRRTSIGSFNFAIDNSSNATPGVSRRQSVRIISVQPQPQPMPSRIPSQPSPSQKSFDHMCMLSPPMLLPPLPPMTGEDGSACDTDRQLATTTTTTTTTNVESSASEPATVLSLPLSLPPPPLLPATAVADEGLATGNMHRIDHRSRAQAENQRIASEFAFEVGGYTRVLHEHANATASEARDVVPWIFPVEFRPINPVRAVRKWVLRHQSALRKWVPPLFVCNLAAFAASTLVAAQSDAAAHSPALILHASLSLLLSLAGMLVLGATVSDRTIFRYLAFKFEVWLTVYQVTYVFVTQLMLPTQWYMWLVLWLWYVINVQIIFFDAAIWYSAAQKRTLIALAFALGLLVFTLDVIDRSNDNLVRAQDSCFFTCASLHVSSMYALLQSMIYEIKYFFKLWRNPQNTIILSVPVQYHGDDDDRVSSKEST